MYFGAARDDFGDAHPTAASSDALPLKEGPPVPPPKPPAKPDGLTPKPPPGTWVTTAQAWLNEAKAIPPKEPSTAKMTNVTVTAKPKTSAKRSNPAPMFHHRSFVHCPNCKQDWPTTIAPMQGCRRCYSRMVAGPNTGPVPTYGNYSVFLEDRDLAYIMEQFVSHNEAQDLLRMSGIQVTSVHHDRTKHSFLKKFLALADNPPTAEQILRLRWLHRNNGHMPQAADFLNSRVAGNRLSARWPGGAGREACRMWVCPSTRRPAYCSRRLTAGDRKVAACQTWCE